jgi:hypothetical protein
MTILGTIRPEIHFDPTAASADDLALEARCERDDAYARPAERWGSPWDWGRYELGPEPDDDQVDLDDDDDDSDPDRTDNWTPIPILPTAEPIEPEPDFEPAAEDRAWLAPLSIADELDDRRFTMDRMIDDERFAAWVELQAGAHRSLVTVE